MKRNDYLCNQHIFHYLITMRQLIDPKDTTRAEAFALWSKSPQPMVTVGKTFNDIQQFSSDYDRITQQAAIACQNITDDGAQKIGTSAVVGTELDYVVNQYTGVYHDPFLVWSRYHRHWFRTTLAVSMQFHHAQMDGSHVARFLERLQQTINELT